MIRVLVGVDGSPASRRAVQFACERAGEDELQLVVLHVIPWSPFSFNTAMENEYRHKQREHEITAAKDQVVDPSLRVAKDAGVSAEGVVRHGHPVDVMVDLAVELDVKHMVVGRTGDSRVRRTVFGSTPGQLVQVAPVPVTVVP